MSKEERVDKLPHEHELTAEVPLAVWEDKAGKGQLDRSALCSILINADHAYIAARFLMWAEHTMIQLAFFLAAQAVELYLKAFLVSRLDVLPNELTSGNRGHDLVRLAEHATEVPDSDPLFSSPDFREVLKRLSPMGQAGRYPRSGYRGPATEIASFLNWLDDFAYRVRELVPYPDNCRDDIERLREFDPSSTPFSFEKTGRGALRDLFFAQNRPFDGWWRTGSGRRIKRDGSLW